MNDLHRWGLVWSHRVSVVRAAGLGWQCVGERQRLCRAVSMQVAALFCVPVTLVVEGSRPGPPAPTKVLRDIEARAMRDFGLISLINPA